MNVVKHYRKHSRLVAPADYGRVIADAAEMRELCKRRHGHHESGLAFAHMQICEQDADPLCFFVTVAGDVFINPRILHRHDPKICMEGCLSYPHLRTTRVRRFMHVTIEAEIFDEDVYDESGRLVTKKITKDVHGIDAQVFQHEIDHMNGKSVWEP